VTCRNTAGGEKPLRHLGVGPWVGCDPLMPVVAVQFRKPPCEPQFAPVACRGVERWRLGRLCAVTYESRQWRIWALGAGPVESWQTQPIGVSVCK
jgi:hypothetical protein